MPRRAPQVDIEKLVKAGRGQGRGRDYTPWINVRSFSSRGHSNRIPSRKTGRTHHLLSNLEADFFHLVEWSEKVIDIREQYPLLPVEETVAIAEALGIHHPTDVGTKQPLALTTDFLLTVRSGADEVDIARTIKSARDLESTRTLEKFEIERQYWRERKVEWRVVTEAEMPRAALHNIRWVLPYIDLTQHLNLVDLPLPKIESVLRELLGRGTPLAATAHACDDKLGLQPGTSLTLVRHLIATRQWLIDMTVPIDNAKPLKILNTLLEEAHGTVHQRVA